MADATAASPASISERKAEATAAPVSTPSHRMIHGARLASPHRTDRPKVLAPSRVRADFFGSRGRPLGPLPRSALPAPPAARLDSVRVAAAVRPDCAEYGARETSDQGR